MRTENFWERAARSVQAAIMKIAVKMIRLTDRTPPGTPLTRFWARDRDAPGTRNARVQFALGRGVATQCERENANFHNIF